MKTMRLSTKALKAELDYCKQKIKENHPSSHWAIREKEIERELNAFNRKEKKNVKSKIR